jgi:hypothetical protein
MKRGEANMKRIPYRLALGLALAAGIASSWPQSQAYPERCWGYRNSQPRLYAGEFYCMGTGAGCSECWNLDGAWCVISGYGFNYICDPYDHEVVIPLY